MRSPLLINFLLLIIALLLSVAVGAVFVPPGLLARALAAKGLGLAPPVEWTTVFEAIVFKIRLPHTALMALVGAALAGSGAAYQGLFRNPLADPYLIGVASGAGLGAVLAMSLQWPATLLGMFAIPVAGFAGALLTVLAVYLLAYTGRAVPNTTLILAGVAVSSFATAVMSFLMLRSQEQVQRAMGFLLGGGVFSGWQPVWAVLPYVVLGLGILLTTGHALNVLQFGEEQAQQMGLAVPRSRLTVVVAASLAAAAAVAFAGIIGFIGLVVPHVMRRLWGPDYRQLISLSILGGSAALLLADLLARVALAPQELPVGVVTALVGAPFFLWVLKTTRDR